MTQFIKLVSQDMVRFVDEQITEGKNVDFNDVAKRFSMDSITSCAFGLEASSFSVSQQKQSFLISNQNIFAESFEFNLKCLRLFFQSTEDTIVQNCKKVFTSSKGELALALVALIPGVAILLGILGISVTKPEATQ